MLYHICYPILTKPIMFTWDIQIWGLFQAFQGTKDFGRKSCPTLNLRRCPDTADGMNSGAKFGKTYADYKR